jgi:4-hydroxy-3-methylbut-2-enyl diphosphate reductase
MSFADSDEIEVTIATNAGACFGVVRAIKLSHQALQKATESTPVYSFGHLIHNPKVVEDLEQRGIKTVEEKEAVIAGTVVLRSHGVKKEIEEEFKAKGIAIVDATCPLVKKPQRIATSLAQKGYFLVVVGDEKHPEIKGVLSYFGKPDFLVTYKAEDIDKIPDHIEKVGVIAQTTIEIAVLNRIVDKIKSRFSDVSVHNTICDATSIRQAEAVELSKKAEVMIVVGGKNSSNTNKLVKICKEHQPNTYHIEEFTEIDPKWFQGKKKIGVTGEASTPHDYVDWVGEKIAALVST